MCVCVCVLTPGTSLPIADIFLQTAFEMDVFTRQKFRVKLMGLVHHELAHSWASSAVSAGAQREGENHITPTPLLHAHTLLLKNVGR